jgi:photosystem II stability/assembly factor-like uncharacterized protein
MATTLWISTDRGQSWEPIPEVKAAFGLPRFDPADPDTAYVMARAQLFRGSLASGTWARVADGPMQCGLFDFAVVASRKPGPPMLYVAGSLPGRRCVEPFRSQVLRSTDGGVTWVPSTTELPGELISALAPDPTDPDVLYAGVGRQAGDPAPAIWKSHDGGTSWSPAGGGLSGASIASLLALPTPGHVWAVTWEGKVFRSTDGGATWESQGQLRDPLLNALAFNPQNLNKLYFGTSRGVWLMEEQP